MLRPLPTLSILFLTMLAVLIVYGDETSQKPSNQSQSPADYLANDAYVYTEIQESSELITNIYETPIWANITTHPIYKKFSETKEFGHVYKSVRYIENNVGSEFTHILSKLFGKRVAFALYERNKKPSAIIISQHKNSVLAHKTVKSMVQLAFMASNMKKMPQFEKYQGVSVMKVKKLIITIGQNWLAISENEELLKDFYARAEWNQKGVDSSLSQSQNYKNALATRKAQQIFAYARYRDMMTLMKKDKFFTQKFKQPLGTLVFGSLIRAIRAADLLSVSGNIQVDGNVTLYAGYPLKKDYNKEYQFASPKHVPSSQQFLESSRDLLFSIELTRDMGKWWENRELLHHENLIPKFVEFNTIIGQLFGGVNVLEDLFGQMATDIRFVGINTKLDQANPTPHLPGFLLTFKAKDPKQFIRNFRVGFQNGIGVINFERAKTDKDALLICSEKTNQAMITGARWLEPATEEESKDIKYNFSPCIARVEDRFFIGSSIEALRKYLNLNIQTKTQLNTYDRFYLSGSKLYSILDQNRDILVWNKTIEVGGDREKATQEISVFLDIIRQFDFLEISTQQENQDFYLKAQTKISKINYESSNSLGGN